MNEPWSRWSQWWRLTEAFLRRFFDNEITSGTNDLKFSFFWLAAFLAPVGFLMPWFRIVTYQTVFIQGGPELLQRFSMADKALYLAFSMVAAGAIGVIAWNALSLDRRDALVLGALPVPPGTVVFAKLAALVIYVALVTAGMHLTSAVSFSLVLGMGRPLSFVLASLWAHLLASTLAGAAVLFAMAGLQGLLLAALGARTFWSLNRGAQLVAAGVVAFGLLSLPDISRAMAAAIDPRALGRTWVLATPPVWFLGLYEWTLGSRDPLLRQLAWRAVATTALVVAINVVTLPMAYHRLVNGGVEGGQDRPSTHNGPWVWLERRVRRPELRGALQFMRITMGRSAPHRSVVFACLGIVVALALPAILVQGPATLAPSVSALAVPLLSMAIFLFGLRIAVSLPADPRARWIFDVSNVPDSTGTSALRLAYYFGIIGPVTIGALVVNGIFWDIGLGVAHAALSMSTGALIAEGLLWSFRGVPCSMPWRGERANLRFWWPAYVALFVLLSRGLPRLSLGWSESPFRLYSIVGLFTLAAMTLWRAGRRRQGQDSIDEMGDSPQTLGLG